MGCWVGWGGSVGGWVAPRLFGRAGRAVRGSGGLLRGRPVVGCPQAPDGLSWRRWWAYSGAGLMGWWCWRRWRMPDGPWVSPDAGTAPRGRPAPATGPSSGGGGGHLHRRAAPAEVRGLFQAEGHRADLVSRRDDRPRLDYSRAGVEAPAGADHRGGVAGAEWGGRGQVDELVVGLADRLAQHRVDRAQAAEDREQLFREALVGLERGPHGVGRSPGPGGVGRAWPVGGWWPPSCRTSSCVSCWSLCRSRRSPPSMRPGRRVRYRAVTCVGDLLRVIRAPRKSRTPGRRVCRVSPVRVVGQAGPGVPASLCVFKWTGNGSAVSPRRGTGRIRRTYPGAALPTTKAVIACASTSL